MSAQSVRAWQETLNAERKGPAHYCRLVPDAAPHATSAPEKGSRDAVATRSSPTNETIHQHTDTPDLGESVSRVLLAMLSLRKGRRRKQQETQNEVPAKFAVNLSPDAAQAAVWLAAQRGITAQELVDQVVDGLSKPVVVSERPDDPWLDSLRGLLQGVSEEDYRKYLDEKYGV
ncbi:MAG: hypothetical protein HUU55_21305 [Myxococcales bacterium]|nr:hypothetical protein [Myxococcales bacterium]